MTDHDHLLVQLEELPGEPKSTLANILRVRMPEPSSMQLPSHHLHQGPTHEVSVLWADRIPLGKKR